MKRDLNLELVRAVSCLLVVVVHVSNLYSRSFPELGAPDYLVSLLGNAAARISVPAFFMISGALLAGREPEARKSLLRARRLFFVTAGWFGFYLVWTSCYLGQRYDWSRVLDTPPSTHLWYLYALLPVYLALPLIQLLVGALERRPPALTALLFVLLGGCVLADYLISFTPLERKYEFPVSGGSQYFLFFLLGHFLYARRERIRLRSGWLFVLLAGGVLGAAGLTAAASFLEGGHNERFFEYRDPFLILAAGAAFVLFCRIPAEKIGGVARAVAAHVSQNSFGIYLFHAVFLNILSQELPVAALPAWAGIPLYTAGIFLLADGSVFLLRRVPGVRFFF